MSNTKDNPLEKDIEQKVCNYAKSKGWLAYKFTSPMQRSVPDRLMITPKGHVFFIEFKRKGEVPTKKQAAEHKKIRAKGVSVIVVDSVTGGKNLIDAYGHEYKQTKKSAKTGKQHGPSNLPPTNVVSTVEDVRSPIQPEAMELYPETCNTFIPQDTIYSPAPPAESCNTLTPYKNFTVPPVAKKRGRKPKAAAILGDLF